MTAPSVPGLAARHAVYFVPADDSALGRFGAAVLGRRPDGAPVAPPPGAPASRAARIERPARYGFHATLKAPFELAPGRTAEALDAAVAELAGARAPVPLGPLELRVDGEFSFLGCASPPPALGALADAVVAELDAFRAPLDDAARARRGADALDPAARARLERWGYPWVFDGFAFHLTLGARGGAASAAEDAAEDAAWREWLEALLAAEDADRDATLDRLAVCVQPGPDGPFVRASEHLLNGATAR